jgi:multidrug efflux pump subunit AcrA (membrane-fusion protein)
MSSLDRPQPAPPHDSHPRRQGGKAPSRRVLVILAAVCLALAVLGTLPRLARRATLSGDAREARAAVPEVSVVRPARKSEESLTLPGNIQAIKETTVQARANGYVRKVYADIGSRVKAGQLLAEIESPETDQQATQAAAQAAQAVAQSAQARSQVAGSRAKVSQAEAAKGQAEAGVAHARQALDAKRAALKEAQAKVAQSTANFRRLRNLLAEGFVARQEVEQALTALRTDKAAVGSAEADVRAAQADVTAAQKAVAAAQGVINAARADVQAGTQNVQAEQAAAAAGQANARRYEVLRSFEKVTAPFDGIITSRNVDEGALISTTGSATGATSGGGGAPAANGGSRSGLFSIAQTGSVRIQVNVPETFAPAVQSGSGAVVTARAVPGREFTGTVNLNAGALDPESRTLLVEVDLSNREGVLVPGMYAEVRLTPAQPAATLRVPGTALIVDAEGTRVAVVSPESRIHLQPVRVGRDFGNQIEILDGITEGQQLVDNPSALLQEGQRVRPKLQTEGKPGEEEGRKHRSRK